VGTRLVYNLAPGAISSAPYELFPRNGKVLFGAYTPSTGVELFELTLNDIRMMSYLPSIWR
jgi:hypothetical protein